MTDLADNYLHDLGTFLREGWIEAERDYEAADPSQREFESGRRRAYRQVLTLMLQQAEAFDLRPSALSLEGIDVETDLGY
jgi:hypothetical protein